MSKRRAANRDQVRARRGSAYLAVLSTSIVAATLLTGAILAQQARLRAQNDGADGAIARQTAEAGISYARAWIAKTPGWRSGTTVQLSNITLGRATFDVVITDPTDSDVADHPYDPVDLTCTARVGRAEQIAAARLSASPVPYDALNHPMHTNGKLLVEDRLILGTATLSINNQLENKGTIEGNVLVKQVKEAGAVTGTTTISSASRSMPANTVPDWYANTGTLLSGVTQLDKRLLTPTENPFGAADPDGIYVIQTTNDVTIKNSRILGTLVVICPGKKVTVENSVLLESASRDYPALVVVASELVMKHDTGSALSESSTGVNFNPAGSPFGGVADNDKADTYPSEVRGLVHVTGTYKSDSVSTLRGIVLTPADVELKNKHTIVYDASLKAWPPVGYAKQVDMPLTAGSLQRVVR